MYTSEDTINNNVYFANAGIHPRIGLEGVGVVQMVVGVAAALLPPKKEMVPDLPFFHFLPFIHFFIFTMCFFLAEFFSGTLQFFRASWAEILRDPDAGRFPFRI